MRLPSFQIQLLQGMNSLMMSVVIEQEYFIYSKLLICKIIIGTVRSNSFWFDDIIFSMLQGTQKVPRGPQFRSPWSMGNSPEKIVLYSTFAVLLSLTLGPLASAVSKVHGSQIYGIAKVAWQVNIA